MEDSIREREEHGSWSRPNQRPSECKNFWIEIPQICRWSMQSSDQRNPGETHQGNGVVLLLPLEDSANPVMKTDTPEVGGWRIKGTKVHHWYQTTCPPRLSSTIWLTNDRRPFRVLPGELRPPSKIFLPPLRIFQPRQVRPIYASTFLARTLLRRGLP